MNRVFPYYELTASIRYGDKPWPEYPHVQLANLQSSQDGISAFTRLYGQLFEDCEPAWPLPEGPMQTRNAVIAKGRRPMDIAMVRTAQRLLQRAWRNSPEELNAIAGHDMENQDIFIYAAMKPKLSVTDTGIELIVPDVWTFARLAFLRDHATGKTAICANTDCITPYFVQSKGGQLFCCHKCAVLTNVRRFRTRKTKQKAKTRPEPKRHKK